MTVAKKHLNPPEQPETRQRRGVGPPAVLLTYLGPLLAQGGHGSRDFTRGPGSDTEYQVSLAPGPYALRVRGLPSGGYLASVLVDGRPPLNGRFAVADGVAHRAEVIIAYDSGRVEGSVTASGEAQPSAAEVYLLPQNPVLPSDVAQATADETGTFGFTVGPGRYDVYALPRDADWNLANSVDRQRLAGYRGVVEVQSGETATVKVKLAPLSSW